MKLLDEIVELAASEHGSVSTLLRKCLVLAHTLKNDRLKVWTEKELQGYESGDEVPEYRKTVASAKGLFVGPFGAQMNNQPIPAAVLKKEHRHFADSVVLFQPIAAYEGMDADSKFVIEWPANLTLMYQTSFLGGYVLNRAWQEVPSSVLIGLIDTVRTRILRLALELKDDLGSVNDDPKELPKEKIDQSVVNNIFGGNVVIASTNFTQIGSVEIGKGDWAGLSKALEKLGLENPAISELKTALDHDSKHETKPGLGKRAANWLAQFGERSGKALLGVGIEVAKKEATKFISQYLGLPPPPQ